MAKITLIKEPCDDNPHDITTVKMSAYTTSREQMLELYTEFLLGIGFVFEGTVEIVEDE